MLKHFVPAAIGLVGTLFALLVYWFVFMPWFHFPMPNDQWSKLVLALLELTAAIYLFGRWRSWPALLLLVGSIPMLLLNISYCGWIWRMDYEERESGTSRHLALLFPSDNEHSPVNTILHYLFYLSIVCLPIAFFLYFFRVADERLTKRLERKAGSH